jgi:protein-S-isoprenylcysteine O-methyltransferase Ste14
MKSKIISIIAFVLIVLSLFFLVKNEYILTENPFVVGIQIFAIGFMFWARFNFGWRSFYASANTSKGELITHGAYKFVRHPIYASVLLFFWSILIAFPTLEVLLAVIMITIGSLIRIYLEEQSLYITYSDYKDYVKKTKRIIPFIY